MVCKLLQEAKSVPATRIINEADLFILSFFLGNKNTLIYVRSKLKGIKKRPGSKFYPNVSIIIVIYHAFCP